MHKLVSILSLLTLALFIGACSDDDTDPKPETDGSVVSDTSVQADLGEATTAVITDIKTKVIAEDTYVEVKDVIVTAVDTFGDYANNIYVQDPAGGKNSGIFIYRPTVDGAQISDLKVGDKVDVKGVIQHYAGPASNPYSDGKVVVQLKNATVTKTAVGTAPTPSDVTADELKSEPGATEWEGVLVRVQAVKVRQEIDTTYGEFRVDSNLQVDDEFYLHSGVALNDCLDIVGIPVFFYSIKLNPRSATDISTSTQCVDAKEVTISSIQDPTNTETSTGTEVKVTGVVTALDANPSATGDFSGFYIQEEGTGGAYKGIYVYHKWTATDTLIPPAIGNKVTVTGIYDEYYDLSEITSVTEIADQGAVTAINPVDVTAAEIKKGSADFEKYEGVLVKVSSVTVQELVQNTDKTKTYGFLATDEFEVKNDLFDFTIPAVNDVYQSLTGVMHMYKEMPQLLVRKAEDLVK